MNKIELLGSAPVSKALVALGIPTMIGMMINALYNIVDAYFVGKLGTAPLGAISVAFPLGQVIVGLGLLFGNGAASYISRLLGRNDKATANTVASSAIYGSVFTGAVVIALVMIFLKPLLHVLGATDNIMPYAVTYTSIYITASIFNIFNVAMNNIVTSEGAAKTTMFALLTGAVLNIALDPILIFGLDMGIAGAAVATAISQIVSTCVYLWYVFSGKSVFTFSIHACSYTKDITAEIFKIGVPTMIFQILTSLSITLINNQSALYGDSVIAGMGAVTRIFAMGSLMVFGFIKGFQPIAGFSYGAKKYDRLKEAIRTSILWSTIFCVIFGLIMVLFSKPVISLFTEEDAEIISVGALALKASGISFMIFGYYTVYSSLLLALGKGLAGFLLGACRQGICFIPVIMVLPMLCGIDGIVFAQPIADVISSVVAVFMALQLRKELR